jgi:hypothetical protein
MKRPAWLKIGAEVILSVIIAPFIYWIVSNIYQLKANANTDEVKFENIRLMLEKQDKSLEKQDLKLDKIMELILNGSK